MLSMEGRRLESAVQQADARAARAGGIVCVDEMQAPYTAGVEAKTLAAVEAGGCAALSTSHINVPGRMIGRVGGG